MLLSLKSTLHRELSDMINPIRAKLQEHDHRMQYIEDKMAVHTAHNQVVDFLQEQDKKLLWINNKVADLEDRSRRNNIKFRGIPECILNAPNANDSA